jgi:plasmid maintenance system antidote protein VapI
MALRLAKATSTTPTFWLDLQREVDLHDASRRLQRELRAVRVVRPPIPRRKLFYKLRA